MKISNGSTNQTGSANVIEFYCVYQLCVMCDFVYINFFSSAAAACCCCCCYSSSIESNEHWRTRLDSITFADSVRRTFSYSIKMWKLSARFNTCASFMVPSLFIALCCTELLSYFLIHSAIFGANIIFHIEKLSHQLSFACNSHE